MQRSLVPLLTVVLLVAAIPAGAAPAAADGFVAVSTTVTPTCSPSGTAILSPSATAPCWGPPSIPS